MCMYSGWDLLILLKNIDLASLVLFHLQKVQVSVIKKEMFAIHLVLVGVPYARTIYI